MVNIFSQNSLNNSKLFKTAVATCSLLSLSVTAPISADGAQKTPSNNKAEKKTKKLFGKISGSGTLVALASTGKQLGHCPLKNTKVEAKISGYVSRVTVKQTFANPFKNKIEAVYTFPLSDTGAVDSMTMKVGNRTIKGSIKKKEEARKIYNRARARGHVASLLDQERPNIFTQSVANIEPGKEVEITIEYIDLLPFENGKYAFTFPTVVGPRFNPGNSISKTGTGRDNDTDQVPDASKITPLVTPKGTRAGHDISINVELDASVNLGAISSKLHQIDIKRTGSNKAQISLTKKKVIPNRDFVLDWQVATNKIESGYLTYRDAKKDKSGYFTLMLLPPKNVTTKQVAAKEMIFLIDCSGSQSGRPIAKAKETLNYIVDHMNPQDTFQIVSFNNRSQMLYDKPKASSVANREKAKRYINNLRARGGTWMEPAVRKVCAIKAPQNRLRIVTFMTDGYVGNDMQIMGLIKELRGQSRWFPFGTGNSVNRFLINGIASNGGGEAEYVLLNSKPGVVGKKFYNRIASPILTDVKVKFDGITVKEVFPNKVADVWAQKPLYIKGRYLKPGAGTVTLTGFNAGKPYKQTMKVNFPDSNTTNAGIASVWARAKVDRLMGENWQAAQRGRLNKELKDEIVEVALKHHIMTQFTSFVAVDTKTVTKNGKTETVVVPVEMPDGVSRDGIFGNRGYRIGIGRGGGAAGATSGAFPTQMVSRGRRLVGKSIAPKGTRFYKAPKQFQISSQNSSALPGYSYGRLVRKPGNAYYVPGKARNRKLQIVSNRPIVHTKVYNKSTDEKDKSEEVSKKQDSKLSSELTSNSLSTLKTKGFTVKGDKVKVKMTLSKFDTAVLKALGNAGVSELKTTEIAKGTYKVTGFVELKNLSQLTRFIFVKFIEPIK